jgi:hypothetical protein
LIIFRAMGVQDDEDEEDDTVMLELIDELS